MRRFCVLLPLLFAACGSMTIPNVPTTHIVMFNGAGTLVDPSHNRDDGSHSYFHQYPPVTDVPAYHKALIDDALANAPVGGDGKRQILIFVHGGLNFQVSSVQNATALNKAMQNAGTYPIFVNWQSSFFSTYWDHIAHIRQGQFWTGVGGVPLAPLWVFSDLVRAVGHAPLDYAYEIKSIRDGIKSDPFYTDIDEQSKIDGTPAIRKGEDLRTPARRRIGLATEVVTLPLKFITAPLVDGFGTGAWDAMQHRTGAMFQSDAEFNVAKPLLHDSSGGLSVFLRELERRIKVDGRPFSITLVGHSMGAIVVNNIVAQHPDLPIGRIVYLAAACSLDDYRQIIVPYLEKHEQTTMHHVFLERHAESREWNAYDLVPRGTLLVWIDNLLSKPESLLKRRAGRFTNLARDIHSTPESIAKRVTVLTFDGAPQLVGTQPQSHGSAGNVKFWRRDCVEPRQPYPKDCMIR